MSLEHYWVVVVHQAPGELALGFQELQMRLSLNSSEGLGPEPGDFLPGLLAYQLGDRHLGPFLISTYWGTGNKLSAWPLVQVFISGGDPEGTTLCDCVQPAYRVSHT